MRVFWVGVAGALGAIARYLIGLAVGAQRFPWATLGINVTGSFILAVIVSVATQRRWSLEVSTAITVGFLGAYTTFSTFAWESFVMARTDRAGAATAYVVASITLGLLAAWSGFSVGRALR